MNKILERIKKEFNKTPDLDIKEIKINLFEKIYVVFLETICDSNRINDYILKNLTNYKNSNNLNSNIPGPNTIKIKNYDEIEFFLTNGFAIIIKKDECFAVEVKGELSRSISTSTREPSLLGPEDSFVENYQTNIGLIKRRIKTNTLKTEEIVLGRKTKTKVGVLYLEDVARIDNVNKIIDKLKEVDTDGIIDVGNIIHFLQKENKTVFPTIKRTERPDVVSTDILEGKIAIIVDTSPFALLLPSFLVDFINPTSDNYLKSLNVAFIKILRLICFILSITAPAIFISIINYNQETIPTSLLINFSMQRSGVPFPSIVELLIMLLICDVLRESDLRFPSNFGSTISILGALIIGEAAVNAGIVSPIMIIITSLTFICSLIFTELELNNAIRYYRYIFLFFASILGLFGFFIASILFLINLISIKSLNSPYLAPISPFDKVYLYKTILKKQDVKNNKRSRLLTKTNLTKGRIK